MCRYMYERRAALALGRDPKFLGVPFAAEWIRQRGHSMKTTIDAIVGTVNMAGIQQEAEQGVESGHMTDAATEAFFEAKKGQITDSLWKLNVLDIEETLTRVVDRVCAVLCCAALCCAVLCCAVLQAAVGNHRSIGFDIWWSLVAHPL